VSPTFTPLAAAGLGIDRAGLLAAMEPFVARRVVPTDPAWTAEVTRDHFRGRIDELPAYGLDPILITDDLPGEI
jgi:hypothetical protein